MAQTKGGGQVIFFVATDDPVENATISELKPDNLLVSYSHFRTRGLKRFFDLLGHRPKHIRLDSGAFTAWNSGRNISPIDYMRFIEENRDYIDSYIALDVIGDSEISRIYFDIMRMRGFSPIPVYHYGEDTKYLEYYIAEGCEMIALGGSAKIRSKPTVAAWCADIIRSYPEPSYHLLGSSSRQVTKELRSHDDFDSSTWILMAINGKPKEIPGKSRQAKIDRAKWQMTRLREEYAC